MQGTRVVRQLPFALLATAAVVVLPALLVALAPGRIGPLVGIPACVALSLGMARGADVLWRRSPRSREVLFGDLMLWGFVRRVVTERRLTHAESLMTEPTAAASTRLRAIERVSAMLESRDGYTRRHSLRVTRFSEGIARQMDLPEDEVARIRQAAALHDVGKFFTPRSILNKPGRLTEDEFAVVKRHPGQGADLLHGVVDPAVETMIRHHHERLGGAGYPDGLIGDDIPLGARIIAVADTFDAMTSTRAYRSARPHAVALKVLDEEAGVALDAAAVAAFKAYYGGRRGTAWSSVASGMTQTVTPLRELLLPAAIGAASVLTLPGVIAPAPSRAADPPPSSRKAEARPSPRVLSASDVDRFDRLAGVAPRSGRQTPTRGRRRAAAVADGTARVPDKGGSAAPGSPRPASRPGPRATPPAEKAPTAKSEPEAPAPVPAGTAAPAQTAAPAVTTEPILQTPEITIPEVEVPEVELPVELPEIKVPEIRLPPVKLP